MRFRRFKKTLVMMLIFTLIMPNFTSVFADTSSKVHVSNEQADLIGSITVYYGALLPLELMPQGASTFAASDNGDNVNDNLIEIIIHFLSGETQTLSRATLIAEGKLTPENPGSLNIFIEDLVEIPTYTISGYIFEDVPPTDYSTVDTNRYVRVSVTLTHEDEDPLIAGTDANGYYEFTDLEPGTYTVNVTDTGGVIQDPQVSEKDGSLNEEVEVTVGPSVNDVNFGYYTAPTPTGTVTILKDVPDRDNDSTPFWVDIYPVDSKTTVAGLNIYDEQPMQPLTLDAGAYMAVETTNPNYTTTYPSLNFSVYEGLNTTITFVNVFIETNTIGGLQIYKDVPNVNEPEDPTVFEFNIFIPGETEPYMVLHGSEITDAYTRLPEGLYHVSETVMPGYTTTTQGYRNIEVVAGQVTDVYFENTLDNTIGGLQIYKDVPNVNEPEDPTVFEFNIFIPGETEPYMVLHGSEITDAYTRLPEGLYHVSETVMPGYTTTTQGYRNIEVVAGQVTDVYFENTLDNTIGGLQIYKDVPNVNEPEDPTVFEFNIFIPGETEPYMVLHGSEITDAYTRLPEGLYHVSETVMPGYTTTTQGYRNIEVVAGQVTDVYFENTLDNTIGGLQIYKDVPNVNEPEDPTVFEFNIFIPGETEPYMVLHGSEITDAYTRLPEGLYHVSETVMPGYTTTTQGYRNIEVVAGQVTDVYFENIYDDEPDDYVVQGYVFMDLDGDNVKDEGETGYEGIMLYLDKEHSTLTDADGYYRFDEIPGQSSDVDLTVGSYVPADYQVSEFDGTLDEFVEVVFGSEYDEPMINFGYLDYTMTIDKTVEDSTLRPGQDAEFTIEVTNTSFTTLSYIIVTDVFEDEDPEILIDNLELGPDESWEYTYTVEDLSVGNYTNVAIAEIIEVFGPIEDDADVSVRRNPPDDDDEYSVKGYVFEDINEDNDVNGDDFGYSGITVELYDGDDDLVDTDVTDSNGRYSFSNLNGEYTVIVDPFGDIDAEQVSEYDGTEDQSVELNVKSNKSNVNFGYLSETPLVLPTIIAGTVFNDINEDNIVDTGEIGYSNVEVTLWSGTTPVLTKMTDANGQYVFNFLIDPELADLEPGDYIVSVGQIPVGVTEVSEYDATLNLMVQLTIEEDTEAIVNVNYGFKTDVVPSGEEANVAMILMGLLLLSSGVILRKKSYGVK